MDIKVYSPKEAANILKVTRRTIYDYIATNRLKAIKRGRLWFITEESLKKFLSD